MSCNGCRVLRKGCSETCILRPCIQWIDTPEAQGHATVFVAKFFGRAGLMSFISNVPVNQRPALFQSLLYEACGRTVNPVSGAVGLLWTGNWHVNQAAVETILRGGTLKPIPEFLISAPPSPTSPLSDDVSEVACSIKPVSHNMFQDLNTPRFTNTKRVKDDDDNNNNNTFDMSSKRCRLEQQQKVHNFDLSLTPPSFFRETTKQRPGTPSFNSEESATTTITTTTVCFDSVRNRRETKLLDLFV